MPLLVLTADRPPELRELGAGQTIDQVKLYGSAAKWYLEVDDHPATPERMRWLRQLACRAFWTATDGRPGPVHLNFSLREPLVLDAPLPDGGARRRRARRRAAVGDAAAHPARPRARAARRAARRGRRPPARRDRRRPQRARPRARRGARRDSPTRSRCRCSPTRCRAPAAARRRSRTTTRCCATPSGRPHAPDLVLRVGDLPTSKPLRQWLHGLDGALQIAFDAENAWQDPAGAVATIVSADPRVLAPEAPRRDREWLEDVDAAPTGRRPKRSRRRLRRAVRAARGGGARRPPPARRDARRRLLDARPRRRDVLPRPRGARRACSPTAAPTASTAPSRPPSGSPPTGRRTVLLIGDVALAHDIGGLLAARRLELDLTIVLLNNDGGGIFHFLPVEREGADFEQPRRHPARARLRPRRRALRPRPRARRHARVVPRRARRRARGGATIIEVRTDRAENVELHRRRLRKPSCSPSAAGPSVTEACNRA